MPLPNLNAKVLARLMVNNSTRPCSGAGWQAGRHHSSPTGCLHIARIAFWYFGSVWPKANAVGKGAKPEGPTTMGLQIMHGQLALWASTSIHSFSHTPAQTHRHPHRHTQLQFYLCNWESGIDGDQQRAAAAATVKVRMPKMQCQRNGNVEKQWKPLRRMFSYLLADSHSFSSLSPSLSSRCACGEVQKCSSR